MLQKWLIVASTLCALVAGGAIVYWYERYHRGPTEQVLVGIWEEQTDDGRDRYSLKPDHTFEVTKLDAPADYGPFLRGRWHAGGRFIYMQWERDDPQDRTFFVWRIDDLSPTELRYRYNPGSPVHTLQRVDLAAPPASNKSLQPTADPHS
jgi:hypothetical protein